MNLEFVHARFHVKKPTKQVILLSTLTITILLCLKELYKKNVII